MKQLVDIEHMWLPPNEVPPTLQKIFEKGVALVFVDEQFIAAIPATNEEMGMLADLNEKGDTNSYRMMSEFLCGDYTLPVLTTLFKQEAGKIKIEEERLASSKYARMASAARFN